MGQIGPAEVLLVLILLWWLATFVVCILKGKVVMALISIVIGEAVLSTIGAIRLAKPESWWARNRYDEAKRERAHARFPPDGPDISRPKHPRPDPAQGDEAEGTYGTGGSAS